MRKIRLPELRWIEPDEEYGVALITGCTSLETILAPKETADLIKRGLEVSDFYPQWEDIQIVAEKEEREESPYAYEVTEEGVVIYGYRGNEKIVEIPEEIEGKPVVALEGDRESHQGFVGEGVKEVILPDTLKRIGSCAFEGTNVQIVTGKGGNFTPFRELSLEEIGEHGFKGCTQLMTIPSAKRIREGAFEGCTSLWEIGLWGTESIEDRAFYGCILLSEVELGEDVEWIGKEAFKYCNNLWEITFPSTLERIGSMAFEECRGLKGVTMNEELTRIESRAFENCVHLEEVQLPKGLRVLERGVFLGCTGLWHVELPEGLKEIEDRAFSGCTSLKGIILPEEIEAIGVDSFQKEEIRSGEAYEIQIYGREGTKTWELLQDERYRGKWKPWKEVEDYKEYYVKREDYPSRREIFHIL